MADFDFVAFGTVSSSSQSYADEDVRKALVSNARVRVTGVQLVARYALCRGSEKPATNVEVASDAEHPYNMGRCVKCGAYVPLLSAGNFEVIKHFAPSNYSKGAQSTS